MNRDAEFFAVQVECTYCGAKPDQWCRDFAGGQAHRVHMKRVRAAAKAGLLPESVVATEKHRRR